ncbi:ATP-binding protein [Actinomadura scrupuli]|uniref:ATP-binding protein n=1 Tax=Actinomadura scrupuli TaxID=559629 RepID=UPI003D96E238
MTGGARGVLLKEVRLRNEPESAAIARREVSLSARAWGVPAGIVENAELCTSETVTNAVVHVPDLPGRTLRLIIVRLDDRYRVEVHDSGRELPRLRQAGADDESGRGYLLVTTLSDAHGAYPRPTGKAVWFEFVAWRGDRAEGPLRSGGRRP